MFAFLKSQNIERIEKPKTLGQLGEEWAAEEYEQRGYKVIAKNEYHHKGKRLGEIDVIVKNKTELVFIEVKTRTAGASKYGTAIESVNSFKQIKLLKAVKLYLLKHPELVNLQPRIDVCAIEVTDIDKKDYSVIILTNVVEDWN